MKNSKIIKIISAMVIFAIIISCMASCRKKEEPENTDDQSTESSTDTGIGGVDVGEFKDILDSNGNKIAQEIYFADGSLKYRENYNADGKMLSSVLYNKDGTKSVEESRRYDLEGNVVEYVTVKYEYENGNLTQYNQSFFNDKKWCTSTYGYNADGSSQGFFTYVYDDAGNEIEKKEYGENMALRFIFETEYDENNLPVKEITKNYSGEVTGISLIDYNDKGIIIKRSECKPDGTVRSYCDYIYDENGKLVEEQIYITDGQGGFIRYK